MSAGADAFVRALRAALPGATIAVDRPAREDGHWFFDVELGGRAAIAEWHPRRGFGVSDGAEECAFGSRATHVFHDLAPAVACVIAIVSPPEVP